MARCKSCNEVFSEFYLKDGVCEDCIILAKQRRQNAILAKQKQLELEKIEAEKIVSDTQKELYMKLKNENTSNMNVDIFLNLEEKVKEIKTKYIIDVSVDNYLTIEKLLNPYLTILRKKRTELITFDDYGNEKYDAWESEIDYFNESTFFPALKKANIVIYPNFIKDYILDKVGIVTYTQSETTVNNILITTENTIDFTIEKRIDIVSVQCIFGINIIKDLFSFVRDIVGGRIKSLETGLDEATETVIKELKEKAYSKGGNAVIGVKIEHTYNNANSGSILSVMATGTVVKLKLN